MNSRDQGCSSKGRRGKTRGTSKTARCPAAGSLIRALSKAVFVIFSEFRLQGDLPVPTGENCLQLRQWWDEWTSSVHVGGKLTRQKKYESTVKGSKRIFDFKCEPCDKRAATLSREAWQKHVATPVTMPPSTWCSDALWLLRKRVRELSAGWGSNLEKSRKDLDPLVYASQSERERGIYVPDQQGCLEVPRLEGGTLAVPSTYVCSDSQLSTVRVGVAKTKGKFRTVTMQSAYVKRVLKPVHAALYDHLSSFGWLVRGDVKRDDYDAVISDLRKGELLISGDYTAATDNIYLEVVTAIVEVLAECPELTEEERKVLVGSFSNLRWISSKGKEHPILRGSMMGNLVSFPLLCLLNKAAFDICCDIFYGAGSHRRGRFNGDDCLFPGTRSFFTLWRTVTGTFGLKVNESKTGISRHWCDLNSQPARVGAKGLNPKPGLSFFRPFRQEPGDILREIWSSVSSFRPSVIAWILNVGMRHEISLREICITDIPKRTLRFLFKKSWFRRALQLGPANVLSRGVRRSPPVVVANPPPSRLYAMVSYLDDLSKREVVNSWSGVRFGLEGGYDRGDYGDYSKFPTWGRNHPSTGERIPARDWRPYEERIDRKDYYARTKGIPTEPPPWKLVARTRWQFIWSKPVYDRFERNGWLLTDNECENDWLEDHPLLKISTFFDRDRPTRWHPANRGLFAPPSLSFPLPSGGVLLPRGYGPPIVKKTTPFVPRRLGWFNPRKLRALQALFRAGS
uniref:RNA-dependent RNA polymerase n=1 Tax=Lianyungang Botou tick virus 3 TaxID=2972058 RepID=A0A9E8AA11_9VIRU|nr:MAG: RNA-dependent RNA polymerase [Lianyungang Botou tick virus 3]